MEKPKSREIQRLLYSCLGSKFPSNFVYSLVVTQQWVYSCLPTTVDHTPSHIVPSRPSWLPGSPVPGFHLHCSILASAADGHLVGSPGTGCRTALACIPHVLPAASPPSGTSPGLVVCLRTTVKKSFGGGVLIRISLHCHPYPFRSSPFFQSPKRRLLVC
jgi:hypothetical protein